MSLPQPSLVDLVAKPVRSALRSVLETYPDDVTEIRLRAMQPLTIHRGGEPGQFVSPMGRLTNDARDGLIVLPEWLADTLRLMTGGSLYLVEEDLRRGFLTLPGGYRVGVAGRVVVEGQDIKSFANVQALAIRIARQIKGVAKDVINDIVADGHIRNCLVISPPGAGKTTMLRDLCRLLSEGPPGVKVTVVDERSEIAACYAGVPQLDVGPRTDILDRCPKTEGILMALRAGSPQVIVTDELGKPAELNAVRDALNCGVAIITSIHGLSTEDVLARPATRSLLTSGLFEVAIELATRARVRRIVRTRTEVMAR